VRNSQRGERAPPRHRLDRGSLIPLLECSPPSPLRPPPPSTTHSPAIRPLLLRHRGPHDHPPSTYSVELESPRVRALHTHSRAYVSSCPATGAATTAATEEEKETERERERNSRVRTMDLGRKRDGGYGEGWPKPPLYLSRSTYTRASGTPTSNVVININGAAQYSPDLASLCVYLWSISLLGQAGLFLLLLLPLPLAGRSHTASSPCYGFRVLRRFTYLVCFGRLKSKGYTRHFLANVRNIEWYLRRNQLSDTTRSPDYAGLCPRSLLL